MLAPPTRRVYTARGRPATNASTAGNQGFRGERLALRNSPIAFRVSHPGRGPHPPFGMVTQHTRSPWAGDAGTPRHAVSEPTHYSLSHQAVSQAAARGEAVWNRLR